MIFPKINWPNGIARWWSDNFRWWNGNFSSNIQHPLWGTRGVIRRWSLYSCLYFFLFFCGFI